MVDPRPTDRDASLPEDARGTAGFLMLEVIVALVIAAMALGFAFTTISENLGRLRQDRDAAAALAVAQSTFERVGQDIPLRPGETDGRTEDGQQWRLVIAPYEAIVPRAAAGLLGFRVEVVVQWTERGLARQVRLQTVRFARAAAGL